MRSYKEIADIVREQGDAILERRRIRAQRIKRISCAVSGLCAAVIIGTAVWHNSALRNVTGPDSVKIPSEITTETAAVTTEAATVTTASTAVTEARTTSAKTAATRTSVTTQTAINDVQTSTKNAVTYQPVTTAIPVRTTTAAVTNGTSAENVRTTIPVTSPGNTSVGDPHGVEEGEEITPATTNTCNAAVTFTTVTTTIAEVAPDVPVTTRNTGTAEESLVTTAATEARAIIVEAPDEDMIKERFNEISFSQRTYTYDRSVDYKPDLTMYMPFDNYWLQAVDETSGTAYTAKTQLYMPETGEKDHIWLKFDKKQEYSLFTANG